MEIAYLEKTRAVRGLTDSARKPVWHFERKEGKDELREKYIYEDRMLSWASSDESSPERSIRVLDRPPCTGISPRKLRRKGQRHLLLLDFVWRQLSRIPVVIEAIGIVFPC